MAAPDVGEVPAARRTRRPRRAELGARVRFEGRIWEVVAVVGATVRLAGRDGGTASVLASHLFADPAFEFVGTAGPAPAPRWGLFASAPARERERALAWQRHIREIETGLPGGPGSGGTPRPEYDPSRLLADREQAKADELAALGWPQASVATVRRMRRRYRAQGLWGLVDQRSRRPASRTGRADERVVAAVREALRRERGRSKGTLTGLRTLTGQILHDAHGPGAVALPPASTFNRLVHALADPLELPARPARTATTPPRPFTTTVALRPGEMVQVDTTRLDVMAVAADGRPMRPELTIAVDVATRSVLAAVLCEEGTKAVDAALLLAEMAVPHPLRPTWPAALAIAHANLPYQRLLALDQRLEHAAARPVVVPETIVVDRGAVFISHAFLAACETLGTSVQPAPPRTPTAKGSVERTFGAINTLLLQHIAGYTGSNPTRRGPRADAEARFTLPQLQDLLDEWITVCWQNRRHEALRHPVLPKTALTPNEMWGALLGIAGYVPLTLTRADWLELLPVRWNAVTDRGIRIDHRTYDAPCLNAHRGQPSPTASRRGRWEIHTHPHDLRQIWIRLPDGQLHEVPWIHRDHVHRPFNDRAWHHIQTALARRGDRDHHEADLADVLDQLLRQARPAISAMPPQTPSDREPTTDTAAPASGPDTAGGQAPARLAEQDHGDSLDALESAATRAGHREEDGELHDEPVPHRGAFALYDAASEADQW
ncbi:transposase [Streptomyces sp. NPDC087422]|uniref:transposase n=1 Tax=Streptomyces sp. NPDC087422 TaxID=3365786 RepID=UPI003811CEE0